MSEPTDDLDDELRAALREYYDDPVSFDGTRFNAVFSAASERLQVSVEEIKRRFWSEVRRTLPERLARMRQEARQALLAKHDDVMRRVWAVKR